MNKTAWIAGWLLLASATFGTTASMAADEAAAAPVVVMKTSMGEMHIELNPVDAPITVENFLRYVDEGYYKGTIFHRVMDGFMIQGGGFTMDMKKKQTHEEIKLESRNGLSNKKYTLAMARTGVPDSATAQFFINVVDNPRLDYPSPDGHGYAVFGRVIKGEDVVDKIKAVKVGKNGPHTHCPVEMVMITSVTRLGAEKEATEKK